MESKESHDITEDLLLRCLNGTAGKEEYDSVWQWARSSPENRKRYRELLDVLVASNLLKPVSSDMQKQVWKQLGAEIQTTKRSGKHLFPAFLKYASVAAVLVFICMAGLYIFNQSEPDNSLVAETGKGEKRVVELSDGSKVWMNEETIFEYSDFSKGNNREVKLTGEAYFEVARNMEKPFVLKTKAMDIEVLGTQFNVKAYDKDVLTVATLVEGSIKVRNDDFFTENKEFILTPGQQLRFNKETKELLLNDVDCGLYIAWKEGKISFEQESFKEILFFMEQNFQITICIEDQTLTERKITGRFELDETPEKMLEILRQSLKFTYYMKNDTLFINP